VAAGTFMRNISRILTKFGEFANVFVGKGSKGPALNCNFNKSMVMTERNKVAEGQ